METARAISAYLKESLDVSLRIRQWSGVSRLPVFLRERYAFFRMDLPGLPCVVMIDLGRERKTPAVIGKQREEVSRRWMGGVLYAATILSATDRSRLVAAKIPFVVPGRQLYLPPLGIDFRERFICPGTSRGSLSPTAQLIVLGVLLGKGWEAGSPTELARQLGYTNMTIGRAFDELRAAGLAVIRPLGRTKRLAFTTRGKELWETALPLLRTPVRAVVEGPLVTKKQFIRTAGLSALSAYSNLSPPENEVQAIRSNRLTGTAVSRMNKSSPLDGKPGDPALLERWTYDPVLLAENDLVDRLSLYLSLRENPDERIEKALDELLDGVQW